MLVKLLSSCVVVVIAVGSSKGQGSEHNTIDHNRTPFLSSCASRVSVAYPLARCSQRLSRCSALWSQAPCTQARLCLEVRRQCKHPSSCLTTRTFREDLKTSRSFCPLTAAPTAKIWCANVQVCSQRWQIYRSVGRSVRTVRAGWNSWPDFAMGTSIHSCSICRLA